MDLIWDLLDSTNKVHQVPAIVKEIKFMKPVCFLLTWDDLAVWSFPFRIIPSLFKLHGTAWFSEGGWMWPTDCGFTPRARKSIVLLETMARRWSCKSLRTTLKQELSVTSLMLGKLYYYSTPCSSRYIFGRVSLVSFLVDILVGNFILFWTSAWFIQCF